MLNIKLRYKEKQLNIKCNLNEKIADVCKKYSNELNTAFESKIFLFDGEKININSDLTFYEKISKSEFKQDDQHELLMYDDPDKCNEGISNYNEIKEVLNYNSSQNKLFPKYGERLYNEDLEEKIPNISDNNNRDTLSDENEKDLSKLLLKDEKDDTKEKNNNRNDENIIIMGDNKVKEAEDKYEIERKNPEKRKKIKKIYSLLFFGALGKLFLTILLSNLEIISEYVGIIFLISIIIVIFIFVSLTGINNCRDNDSCHSFTLIIYNIAHISFFTSLKIVEEEDKNKFITNCWQFFFGTLIFNYVVILLFFFISKSLNFCLPIFLLISCVGIIVYGLKYFSNINIWDVLIIAIYIFFQNISFISIIYSDDDQMPLDKALLFFHFFMVCLENDYDSCKVWVCGCC